MVGWLGVTRNVVHQRKTRYIIVAHQPQPKHPLTPCSSFSLRMVFSQPVTTVPLLNTSNTISLPCRMSAARPRLPSLITARVFRRHLVMMS
jgi:hypothetical protein